MLFKRTPSAPPRRKPRAGPAAAAAALAVLAAAPLGAQCTTTNTVIADVVALDQFVWYNRLGARDPAAMLFALKEDVVSSSGGTTLSAGNVRLRDGKRPRPLTLRVAAGGCLQVNFTNLLSPTPKSNQPGTRAASVHVAGMQPADAITSDGSNVGTNPTSLVEPGASRTYKFFAEKEGTFLLYSTAQTTGGDGDGGQISRGLFGAVNVQPAGAEFYRSQVTAEDLRLAQKKDGLGNPMFTDSAQPVVDYAAVYPAGHPRAGLPIMRMTQGAKLVHGDLNAIITGPGRGNFAASAYPVTSIPVSPERLKPFREFTVIFHDEVGMKQAFDSLFNDPKLEHTLHSGRDAFAINYGTGGIGAEVLANRFGLGPMKDCNDCAYEEFFLSSWAVGDPAMVVDVPAAADFRPSAPPAPGTRRATKAFYPDDPSNVFHSYMNDHVKIRNLHAGPKEHHVFHLHAHQWLHTPNSDNSSYLDSQAIGPGAGFTYEITYNGSSNRNKTPGDAILHCHFYPHFAQGMWGMWRVHDSFEAGTRMDADGTPAAGARALPDGEILEGTPIPAVVPMPTYALAPMPSATHPGFPFYIPGVAGHRPPRPPLDVARDAGTGKLLHGGLQRHVIRGGTATWPALNRFDFSKTHVTIIADSVPEAGTLAEQRAMAFHAARSHRTFRIDPSGAVVADTFVTNGRPQTAGAPFADPCVDDRGAATGNARRYKAASFQTDVTYNKANWHFPQHRMFALFADVDSIRTGKKAPEPLFFRANTGDCINYHLVNLVPKDYQMDDFQVKTPTDIIGQHIHLVKFDVTSSDGAANGWNYEDGSLAPDEVVARINAIRKQNGCTATDARNGSFACPTAETHPYFGPGPSNHWVGAQETVQRWYVDNVLNNAGKDRTLRTVFSHDHFGPSTHQQAGLYAGLVTEPAGSTWRDPDTGVWFGSRALDGGPTSWRADIVTSNPMESYREFNLQVSDFTLAYGKEGLAGSTADQPINPPGKFEPSPILPFMVRPPKARNACPVPDGSTLVLAPPCPELLSADDPGTMVVNYRSEPLAMRLRNPATNTLAAGDAGNLSLAFSSEVTRADPRFNSYGPYGPRPGEVGGDPFTPLMRAREDDKVQIRVLVGAHEEGHNFSVHGVEWLFEPSDSASGYRNSQMMGISEHHEFVLPPLARNLADKVDYLYQAGSASDDLWNGLWGLIRVYRGQPGDYVGEGWIANGQPAPTSDGGPIPLPNNPDGADARALNEQSVASGGLTYEDMVAGPENFYVLSVEDSAAWEGSAQDPLQGTDSGYGTTTTPGDATGIPLSSADPYAQIAAPAGANDYRGTCPRWAPIRRFDVSAVAARKALPSGRITYNSRTANGGPLYDASGVLYVYSADLTARDTTGTLKAGVAVEPLVLRANAGDCIQVTLRNLLPSLIDPDGYNTLPMIVDKFNANQLDPSRDVGLHAQLLAFDPIRSDGSKVGLNPRTTVQPNRRFTYQWYAGEVKIEGGNLVSWPVEYGAINLMPSDRIKQTGKGAIAGMVIEPHGSTWSTDSLRASATVSRSNGTKFREFVLLFQDDVNLRFGSAATLPSNTGETHSFAAGSAVPNLADAEDAEDSGQKAFNYRTEPLWLRMGFAPDADLEWTRTLDFRRSLKNALVGDSITANPQTPLFKAAAGEQVRFRLLQPGGHARNHVFNLHGHIWEELPFLARSKQLGSNPLSEWNGMRDGIGASSHFNLLLKNGAGGKARITGDFLYRDQQSFMFDGGLWGILRVTPAPLTASMSSTESAEIPVTPSAAETQGCTVNPATGQTVCN